MEVLKGLDYMEDRKPVRSNQRAPVPVVATPPPDPVATRESGNTPVDAEGESSSTTPAELMSALISWSEKAQGADVLQDENALFIGSPAGIAQFIEESTVVTSIAQVQKALLESGAIKVKKTVNKKSVNGYQLEAAHV